MKKTILVLTFLAFAKIVSAQQSTNTTIIEVVNMQATFAGPGTIFDFLGNNLHYPANAVKKRIQGKVYVQFIIQKNGKVPHAKIIRSVSAELDTEALTVINLTIWRPAIQNSKPVNVSFVIPISYKLPPLDTANQPKTASDADVLNQPTQAVSPSPYPDMSSGQIFSAVENPPNYPDGWDKFKEYISLYLKQSHNQYQGTVVVQFVVEKDGTLSNFKVIRGTNPDADATAITIMKNCGKFNPGIQNGHAVRCYFTVPIKFIPVSSE